MTPIDDMEHFVLQPGETLILRARRPLSSHQMQTVQTYLDERKLPAVVIAGPEFDIMAGMLSTLMPDDGMQAHADAVCDAYDEGKLVWFRPLKGGDDWFQAHRAANPISIDFELYQFSLTKPGVEMKMTRDREAGSA